MLPTLKTERLYFRPLQESDLAPFTDMQSNANVMRYAGEMKPMSTEECEKDLLRILDIYQKEPLHFRIWAVCLKKNDEFIGTGALITEDNKHEIGYRMREKFWGNGFGTELNNGILELAFDHYGFDEVWAEADQRNTASVKILDRSLKRIKAFFNEESKTDDFYYELSKLEYEKK